MALHDHKCHIAPHFDCVDIMNAVVPLTKMSTPHAAETFANVDT